MAEAAWREALRRMRRPPGAGFGGPEGRALRLFGLVVPLANFAGALDVFVFLFWILPPSFPSVHDVGRVRMVNEIAFAVFMPGSMVVGAFLGTLIGLPILHWLQSGRAPDDRELALTLR